MVISKANGRLNVFLNGILVGKLEKPQRGGLTYQYEKSWLERPGARPISLSLPLSEERFVGDVVYNFFDNLLPDNPRIRARIQTRFQIRTDQPFDLLASIGRDCIGAIQITNEQYKDIKHIDAVPMNNKEIANMLKNYREAPLGMEKCADDFRISIAGAQEKSALLYRDNQWCRPLGTTPTSHIFKLPICKIERQNMDLSDSCENEWLCAKIAEAFGLQTAPCFIEQFEDVKVLIVERFDRKLADNEDWFIRLPQEDLCQALGYSSNLKYQMDGGPGVIEIMKLLLNSVNAKQDREQFYQAQIVFWLLAAIDGHAKNFSVFIEPFGRFKLTPLYDIMSAYPLMANRQLEKQKVNMAMALRGKNNHYKWSVVQRQHFISTAKLANFSINRAASLLDETLSNVDNVVNRVSDLLPENFPTSVSEPIFEGMMFMRDKLQKG